ncbi:MAG: EamA family transporter, partial [Faecalibacterium prausnitzii]
KVKRGQRFQRFSTSLLICFLNLFVGGLALFVLGTVMGGRLHVQSALAAVVMLYLAFICGAGCILWALLMKNNPVSRIAIFGFVSPVVNVLLSAVARRRTAIHAGGILRRWCSCAWASGW